MRVSLTDASERTGVSGNKYYIDKCKYNCLVSALTGSDDHWFHDGVICLWNLELTLEIRRIFKVRVIDYNWRPSVEQSVSWNRFKLSSVCARSKHKKIPWDEILLHQLKASKYDEPYFDSKGCFTERKETFIIEYNGNCIASRSAYKYHEGYSFWMHFTVGWLHASCNDTIRIYTACGWFNAVYKLDLHKQLVKGKYSY